jgi:RND family efflux transporter MFP subunit
MHSPTFALLRSTPAGRTSVLVALVALTFAGCTKPAASSTENAQSVIVQAATPASAPTEAWSGTIRARDHATLSFSVAGHLQRLLVEVGDRVESGTVLAELEQEPFALSLRQAEAEAQAAAPALDEAQRRRDAEQRLHTAGATSRTDLDAAVSAHAAAAARLQAAEASLALARRQLRESRLLAPRAGRVAQRLVQSSTWVDAGATVIEFDPEGPIEVVLAVPATRAAHLTAGQEVVVTSRLSTPAPARAAGRISHIGQRSLAGGVHEVLVRLPDDAVAFPGEAVLATLPAADVSAGVRIPITAVQPATDSGAGHVFVFEPKTRRLALRQVRFHSPHGADVIVDTGVRSGELVAVAGLPFLRDGQTARAQLRE